MKILIVDDHETNNKVLKALILRVVPDANVTVSNDPIEALKLVETCSFDRILTDYMMPNITGDYLAERVRWSEINSKTPVAIVSAYAASSVLSSIIAIYEDVEVIPKPIDRTLLAEFLSSNQTLKVKV